MLHTKYAKKILLLLSIQLLINIYHTLVIAFCLLSQEKTENYAFALTSYQNYFGKLPDGVYTDREIALTNAIDIHWPFVKRRICTFHLHRNVQQYVGDIIFLWDYKLFVLS